MVAGLRMVYIGFGWESVVFWSLNTFLFAGVFLYVFCFPLLLSFEGTLLWVCFLWIFFSVSFSLARDFSLKI